MKQWLYNCLLAMCLTPFVFSLHSLVTAQVMTSTNYQIQSDSINTGGGYSSSTNYQQQSTIGEVATGVSDSTSYSLRAGYQQMQTVYIAITPSPDVVLGPSIPGVTGGVANGSTTVTVITDGLAGYELSISATESPALRKGAHIIADYTPAGAAPDFTFTTAAADAHFAYTPEGADVTSRFLDNGAVCGSGADTNDRCWDGLSTSPEVISEASTSNHPDGSETVIKFRVGVGGSVVQAPGVYTATTTLTAIAL